jgi:hypothetical protein
MAFGIFYKEFTVNCEGVYSIKGHEFWEIKVIYKNWNNFLSYLFFKQLICAQ